MLESDSGSSQEEGEEEEEEEWKDEMLTLDFTFEEEGAIGVALDWGKREARRAQLFVTGCSRCGLLALCTDVTCVVHDFTCKVRNP